MKRPWGRMWTIFSTTKFWIKILQVKERTSLQFHSKRTEWHLGIYKVKPFEKHRLLKGLYIEVASGEPKEEDIVRLEDDYNRK